VFRWAPGERARWQAYPVDPGPETTVLDALVEIQRTRDPTLAFRYACRVGMCGSCGVVVNGRERWACRTRLRPLGPRVSVRPLYHLPVLRDLVVDMTGFVDRWRAARGVFVPRPDAPPPAPPGPERQEIDQAIECIGCGLCLSACTMVGWHPRFPGPAALNRALTLQRDPRDAGQAERWAALLSEDALFRCHGQGACVEVCPMGLAPAASVGRLRQLALARLVGRGGGAGDLTGRGSP
jgi:fumarate reductase iron-sulfur subunit